MVLGPALTSLLILLVFIAPGFVATGRLRQKLSLKKDTTFELTAQSIVFSVFCHLLLFCLLWATSLIPYLEPFYQWATTQRFPGSDSSVTFADVFRGSFIVIAYTAISIVIGLLLGAAYLKLTLRRTDLPELMPVWVNVFNRDDALLRCKVRTKFGVIYVGEVATVTMDRESIDNGQRDITIDNA